MQSPTDAANISNEPGDDADALAELLERRHQMTLEALKEIADGHFVDHEVIEKWIEGLE